MSDVVFDLFNRPVSIIEDSHKVRTINLELMLNEYFQPTFESLEELRAVLDELTAKPEQFKYTLCHKLGKLRQAVYEQGICPVCGLTLQSRETHKQTDTTRRSTRFTVPAVATYRRTNGKVI